MTENSVRKTEDPLGADTASTAGHSNGSGGASSLNGFDEVLIKTEPESGGSTPVCVQSPPLSGNSTAGSKAPPSTLPFAPTSSSSSSSSSTMACSNGRYGRSFSTPDAKRRCPGTNNHSSPLLEDENDLKLKPYDFLNNVIKTPPIKPLEEGDDPPITPSPTRVGPFFQRSTSNPPTNNSCTSNHSNQSNPPSTPTRNGISNNIPASSLSSSQMDEDLNEFYRVMEQVCEQKGRLSSASGNGGSVATATMSTAGATSTQIDMYSSMSPPPGVLEGGAGGAGVATQRIISPPPYNATSTGTLPQTLPMCQNYGGNRQQMQHAVLTSPPGHAVSPPYTASDARSLYTRSLVGQQQQPHAPSPSFNLQQRQQGQVYSTAVTQTSMPSGQVNLFSSDHSSLHAQPPAHHPTAQQQAQIAGKPLDTQQTRTCPPPPQQSMQLSHMSQNMASCPTIPTPTATPTSHMYYNGSQSQQQRVYTSAAPLSLPPHPPPAPPQQQQQQTPLTPTTPLEHFSSATFQTSQSSRISPTHRSTNPLCHPGGVAPYTSFSDTSHYLSNQVQTPCLGSRSHQQSLQMPAQQHRNSRSLTVSTNSWASGHSRLATQQLSNMMTAQHAAANSAMIGRSHVASLPNMQVPGQASSLSMSSYQLHQRMGHLQHHSVPAPPPAYLQSCGSSAHPGNAAAFSGLPFP